jgi:hypothetical protein
MAFLSDLRMYTRFAWGLRGFLKHILTLDEAKAIVKKRMEGRETNFLRLIRRGIFGCPKSPYLPLLKLAGCELDDIENRVRTRRLEDTLRPLRGADVYNTFRRGQGGVLPIDVNVLHLSDGYLAYQQKWTTELFLESYFALIQDIQTIRSHPRH